MDCIQSYISKAPKHVLGNSRSDYIEWRRLKSHVHQYTTHDASLAIYLQELSVLYPKGWNLRVLAQRHGFWRFRDDINGSGIEGE